MTKYKTEQETFWAGQFGDDYIERNVQGDLIEQNTRFFNLIKKHIPNLNSVLEFGANVGLNLNAIHNIWPQADITGVEINEKAFLKLKELNYVNAIHDSFLNIDLNQKWEMTFTKTVMIHINPEELTHVYKKLYDYSSKYIFIVEYYNTTPTEINYRGHSERLFKRDFAGDFIQQHPDCSLIDYGFIYHKDPNFNLFDDQSWFLLKKN